MCSALLAAALFPAAANAGLKIKTYRIWEPGVGGVSDRAFDQSIALGPDDAMWFLGDNWIGRIDATGHWTHVPYGPEGNTAYQITRAGDSLWITREYGWIDRVESDGTDTQYQDASPSISAAPLAVTEGPDGTPWYGEGNNGRIGHIDAAGQVTTVKAPWRTYAIGGVAAGPGGIWFSGPHDALGRFSPEGQFRLFRLPHNTATSGLVIADRNAVWTAGNNRLIRVTERGSTHVFHLPRRIVIRGLAAGPNGSIWFTALRDQSDPLIGRLSKRGRFSLYYRPRSSDPTSLALGPGGMMWYTDAGYSRIGRFAAY